VLKQLVCNPDTIFPHRTIDAAAAAAAEPGCGPCCAPGACARLLCSCVGPTLG
jgi:hypothetical protein